MSVLVVTSRSMENLQEYLFSPKCWGNCAHMHAVETRPFLLPSNGPGYKVNALCINGMHGVPSM